MIPDAFNEEPKSAMAMSHQAEKAFLTYPVANHAFFFLLHEP